MTLLDYFSHGARKKHKNYFAALVKIAFADGELDKKELLFLERMARRLGITEEDFSLILKHPEKYKLDPPLDYDERIEQLYYFTRMVFSDDEIKLDEVKTVRRLATALGFPPDNVEKVTDEAIHLIMNDNRLEDFTEAIKRVNSI